MIAVLWIALVFTDAPRTPAPCPELLTIKRVYVDRLTGGETAAQMRDLIVASLQNAKLFMITENEQRADAFLRGAAEDLVYTDKFNTSDSINARAQAGEGRTSSRGSRSASVTFGENESAHIEERKHEAMATVRLVNKEGDVIWSTTQESVGAKFRGASADVADKITKKLMADFDQARRAAPRLP